MLEMGADSAQPLVLRNRLEALQSLDHTLVILVHEEAVPERHPYPMLKLIFEVPAADDLLERTLEVPEGVVEGQEV